MAVIKIPSSNIYDIGDETQLTIKNKIQQAELSVNSLKKEFGNVLSKEYVITYWEPKVSDDGTVEYIYVGDDPSKNEILFQKYDREDYLSMAYIGSLYEKETIKFPIGRLISFDYDASGYVAGYTIVRKRQYTVEGYFASTIYNSEKISYNSADNTFSFEIEDQSVEAIDLPSIGYGVGIKMLIKSGLETSYNVYLMSETITVIGEYYSPEEVINKYGDSGKSDISLPTNELMQEGSKIINTELSNRILQNVVGSYSKGKEVYELKCSIANYYDTSGRLAISPTQSEYPASFKKYDIVEPYVFTSKGEVPLSAKADGTPKQFEIIGIDYSYAGVVWQKLTLQEYYIQ